MRRARGLAWVIVGASLALATPARAAAPLAALDPVEIYADGFDDLRGIVVDPHGSVFVADRGAGTVARIAPDHSRTLVASGLKRPIGLAWDPAGRLLVAEEKAGRVVRLEPTGGSRTVIVSGVKQPRWLAVREDGTVFISARRLTHDADDEEEDDEAAEPELILVLTPAGQLHVFADRFKGLQGLVANPTTLFAATRGRRGQAQTDGVVFRIPILADGRAGAPMAFGPRDAFKKPVGLARDRLGALYLTTPEVDRPKNDAKHAVAKLHPTAVVTVYAEHLTKPQGLAFDQDGHLYVADGSSGRVFRFRAPPPPTLTAPEFTNHSPLAVTGTTLAGARVDLVVNDALTPATTTADATTGHFSVSITLADNQTSTLEAFATRHAGHALPSRPAEASVVHDDIPPGVMFVQPAANAYVRGMITVEAQATDANTVASLALSADAQTLSSTLTPSAPASPLTATASWTTTTVIDGTHTLGATATDRAGNTATTTRVVILDNTPPDTQITTALPDPVTVADLTFSFTGSDILTPVGNLVFAWRLGGGAWSAFTSATTATMTGLTEGPHTFEVKALDLAGNEDLTPAAVTFTVRFGPSIMNIDPPSGPIGTYVTITGTNFEPGATQVSFNGLAAIVRTVTATQITTTVPIGATTGPLTVTTSRGSASLTFTVTTTGDFTLTAAPTTVRAIAGDQTSVNIAAGGTGSFTSLVSLMVSTPPTGIGASFSPSTLVAPGSSAFVNLALASTVAPGSYNFTVTGQAQVDGQTLTRMTAFTLEVLAPDTTAITGRVLTAEAVPQPIPGVTITLGSAFTLTDAGGNFVLLAPPPGANMLLVDGRTASTPTVQYPPVEVNIAVNASGPTRVPFIVYLPKLDTANPVSLPLDGAGFTTQEVKASTPLIPGLVVTIPTGTQIIGPDGNPVSQLTITPVPVDRSPMPFPPGITPPMLFSIQPGGAVPSQPLPISFPNTFNAPAGTKANLYFFDLAAGNWSIWGRGTVDADGIQVVPDPGAGLPRFAWHFQCDEFGCFGDPSPAPEFRWTPHWGA